MRFFDMNRRRRVALLAVLLMLILAIVVSVSLGRCSKYSDTLAVDSVEMARFQADIDSAHIKIVKHKRKKTKTTKQKSQNIKDYGKRRIRQLNDDE